MDVNRLERRLFFRSRSRETLVEKLEESLNHQLMTKEYPLPGCNLKYEYSTLTSDHRSAASGLFRWFRSAISHCNPQNGRELVNEMVQVFQLHKHELPASLQEFVLYEGLIDVCYKVQIDDSQLMRQVLDLWHDNDSSFFLLHDLVFYNPSYFRGSRERREAMSHQTEFLTFYLEHARRLKLEYNGSRFIDVSIGGNTIDGPVVIAAEMRLWKPLLRYLQFGANFEDITVDPSDFWHREQSALTFTLHFLMEELWIQLVKPATALSLTDPKEIQEYCSNLNREVRDLCRTLKIIFRTVKHLRHNVLDFVIRDYGVQWIVLVPCDRVINHPTVQLMLPTLNQRYRCPMQLQHACRWTIRARLNENWQLPVGINHLPISSELKKYLNLLSD